MVEMRKRSHHPYKDRAAENDFLVREAKQVFRWAFIVVMVVGILTLIAIASTASSKWSEWKIRDQYARNFNALTKEQRATMVENNLVAYPNVLNAGGYYALVRDDEPLTGVDLLAMVGIRYMLFLLAIAVLVAMVATFYFYATHKTQYYFFVDFPGTPKERTQLLLRTLIFFPVYLVSYSNLRNWEAGGHPGLIKKEYAYFEDTATSLASRVGNRIPLMAEAYGDYHQGSRQARYQFDTKRAEDNIKRYQAEAEKHQKAYDDAMKGVSEYEAQLQKLKENPPDPLQFDREAMENELKEIALMRGVTDIRVVSAVGSVELNIDLSVRIPYKGRLYMGGDYTIIIYDERKDNLLPKYAILCKQTEEDLLIPHPSKRPYYFRRTYSSFCFGTRSEKINTYLKNGEIVAAVNLMIDGMHSVSKDDQVYIPQCYRQIVQYGSR